MPDNRNSCFMIGSIKSTGGNPTSFVPPIPLPTYHYPGIVPYHQYPSSTVQYHAPVTYHTQSICTKFGTVSGNNPTYLYPNSCGATNYKD
jgi:hypothetical protein